MNNPYRFVLIACLALAPAAAAVAQATKPATKTTAKPAARPATKPAPKTSATTTRAVAKPAPAPAPAPTPPPPPPAPAATSSDNSSDKPFDVGTNAVNVGIGFGSSYSYAGTIIGGNSSVTPAFSVSFERGIIAVGPGIIGGGIILGYQQASYESSTYKDKYYDVIVAARGAFHYPVSPAFDAYGGVGLGIRHVGYSSNYSTYDYSTTYLTSNLFVGGRYFFTSSLGGFAELGYDQTYLKAGLTAKF